MTNTLYAPGWPGIPPRWTSSAKIGVGTALNQHSKVWFTLSHGILNEVYFPRVDQACTRDLGLHGHRWQRVSSPKKNATVPSRIVHSSPESPPIELINTEINGRYRIRKEILTDPYRNVVLQKIRFEPLQGKLSDYRLYALLSPHLANCGARNTGWVGDYKGVPMLFAQHDGTALALACSVPWRKMSVGFVGTSDGWQDLSRALPNEVGIQARRKWQHRLHRRNRSRRLQRRIHPGAWLRRHLDRSRPAGPLHFAGGLRRAPPALCSALEELAAYADQTRRTQRET